MTLEEALAWAPTTDQLVALYFNRGEPAPYTHWAYFGDLEQAQACAGELDRHGLACGIVRDAADEAWLLRAHDVPGTRNKLVRGSVERHGGEYDGGEAAFSPTGGSISCPDEVGPRWPERS